MTTLATTVRITEYQVQVGETTVAVRYRGHRHPEGEQPDLWLIETAGEGALIPGHEAAVALAQQLANVMEQARLLKDAARTLEGIVGQQLRDSPWPPTTAP